MYSRSDTVSKFYSTADKYSAVNSPIEAARQQKLRRELQPTPTDTIEQPKLRNERQVPLRAGESSLNKGGEFAFKAARAGRFIFMAVGVPAYLLIYKVPRWTAALLAPLVAKLVETSLENAKKFFKQINQWLTLRLGAIFRTVGGMIRWSGEMTSCKLAAALAFLRNPFESLKAFFSRCRHQLGEGGKRFARRFYPPLVAAAAKGKALVDALVRGSGSLMIGPLRILYELVRSFLIRIFAFVVRCLSLLRLILLKIMTPPLAAALSLAAEVKKILAASLKVFAIRMEAFLVFVSAFDFVVVKYVVNAFGVSLRLTKWTLWSLHLLIQRGLVALPSVAQKLEEVQSRILGFVARTFLWFFTLPLFHVVARAGSKVTGSLARFLLFLVSRVAWLLERLGAMTLRLMAPVTKKAGSLVVKVMGVIGKSLRPVSACALKCGTSGSLLTKLFFKGVSLFFKYSYEMVEEAGESIGNKISPQ